MRRNHMIFFVTGLFVFALASLATGQMMGNDGNHMMMNAADSNSQIMMNRQSMMKFDSMMGTMSQRFNMMSADFDSLEFDNQQMMQMNNLDAVKKKLKQQNELLQEMHQRMMNQESMLKNMQSMMPMHHSSMMNGSNGMHGSENMHNINGSGNSMSSNDKN